MPINIMVVEDHPIVRDGIVGYLNACDNMQVIAQADTIQSMLLKVEQLTAEQQVSGNKSIDIVLLDLQLGEHSSIAYISQLSAMGSRVLVLSSAHRYETLIQAISAGAFGFISKSIMPDKLASVISDAYHGKRYLSPDIKPEKDIRLALEELSNKELTVLKMLAAGLNNSDIAKALNITIKTVRFHSSNILSKLDINDRTQAAVLAWRQGLVR